MRAVEQLEREADNWKAVGEEQTEEGSEGRALFAIAEYALARHLDRCWRPAVGRLDTEDGDLCGLQVKSTKRASGSLIVRRQDPARFVFVLAIVRYRLVELVGWIEGERAKVPAYWRDVDRSRGIHQAAYFVPQAALRPIEELGLEVAA